MGYEAERLGGGGVGDLDRVERVRATGVCHLEREPRRASLLVLGGAGVGALRRERHEHVLADAQAAPGERLDEQLARGTYERARAQHDRLTGARVLDDRRTRTPQRLGDCLSAAVDGRWHADQHPVGGAEVLELAGQLEVLLAHVHTQVLPVGAWNLGTACANLAQATGGRVDADDANAGATQRDRARQARVAEPHDGDERAARLGDVGGAKRDRRRLAQMLAAAGERGALETVPYRRLEQILRCHFFSPY